METEQRCEGKHRLKRNQLVSREGQEHFNTRKKREGKKQKHAGN